MQTLDEAECTTATTFTRHDQRITSTAGLREESMYSWLGRSARHIEVLREMQDLLGLFIWRYAGTTRTDGARQFDQAFCSVLSKARAARRVNGFGTSRFALVYVLAE